MPLVGLGVFGPLLGALLAARHESGRGGARELFRSLRLSGAGVTWSLVALLLPGTLLAAGMALYGGFGHPRPWFYPPAPGPALVALFVIPWAEEIGWRGFAFPRLQQRYGALVASLILGTIWAVWHTPQFLLVGLGLEILTIMIPFFVAGSIVFTWLFNRRGGFGLVILAHMGAHLSNSHASLPGDPVPLIVHTVGFGIVAFVLILQAPVFKPISR